MPKVLPYIKEDSKFAEETAEIVAVIRKLKGNPKQGDIVFKVPAIKIYHPKCMLLLPILSDSDSWKLCCKSLYISADEQGYQIKIETNHFDHCVRSCRMKLSLKLRHIILTPSQERMGILSQGALWPLVHVSSEEMEFFKTM